MIEKIYYTKHNLTQNIDCSLNPPSVFDGSYAECDFYSADKRKWQSAPYITKSANGNLYATFSGDNYGGDEQPNNYNVILKSCDNGKTWKTVTVIDHMDSVRLHEPILWRDANNRIWHFWAQSYNWWDGRGGVWSMYLADEENNIWSEPKRLCNGVMATAPITLKNKKIMLPVSIWKCFPSEYHRLPELEKSSVYISEDNLESVLLAGSANEPNTTFDENAIVERSDGSIYMIMRTSDAITYSISEDEGKTWSECKPVMKHASARSYLSALGNGKYLLVTNNNPKERSHMTAFLSEDECMTWTPKLLLDEKCSVSYPGGCVDENDRVYVAYDYNRYNDEEVFFATFTTEELTQGKITHPDSGLQNLIEKGKNGKSSSSKVFEDGSNQEI